MIMRPIILLVLTLFVGFSLLGVLWEGSMVVKGVVGLTVVGLSVWLLILAKRFDRALNEKRGEDNDAKDSGVSQ